MKLSCLHFAVFCCLPLAVAAQQTTLPQGGDPQPGQAQSGQAQAGPAQPGPAQPGQPQTSQTGANPSQPNAPQQVQPQVWPPAKEPDGEPAEPPAAAPARVQIQAPAAPATPAQSGQIELDVVVTDKGGHPVSGLTRRDFTLLDDNRPTQIDSFLAYGAGARPADVQVILVIDTVNIGFQEVSYSRFGIDQFLRKDGGRLAAPTSVYWYADDGIEGGEAPTTDGNAIAAKLDATEGRLRSINRAAGAWGAVERFQMSLQTLDRIVQAAAGAPSRKLLIWIGPGWPMLDNPNIEMTWKQQETFFHNIVGLNTGLRQAHMTLYSVTPGTPNSYTFLYQAYTKGVKKASQVYLPDLDLKVLAAQSGGQVLTPSNDLAREIEACARDASAYYTLTFTPPRADGPDEYHELKVQIDKPGLSARTNTGYYNQPPTTPQP